MTGGTGELVAALEGELQALREAGTYKVERELQGPQGAEVEVDGREVVMLTSNNYLGLADHPRIREAAREALERWGYGMASVRFICGTDTLHLELERRVAGFFETDAAILYTSCWNANEALFAGILGEEDAVFSDELNHASIIDGIRLCKAKRYRYAHSNVDALAEQLESDDSRHRVVVTDEIPIVRTGDVRHDLEENSRRFNREIEMQIRRCPEQWFWLHRRWKKRE